MKQRAERNWIKSPVSIYEVHLGSWRRKPEEGNRFLSDTGAIMFGGFVRFDVLVFDASTRSTIEDNLLFQSFGFLSLRQI